MSLMLQNLLLLHEGYRPFVYDRDTGLPVDAPVGKAAIGIGRNLEQHGVSKEEAFSLLRNDIEGFAAALDRVLPWFKHLDPVRQAALIDMAFSMGTSELLRFGSTLNLLAQANYAEAGKEMLNSSWAYQSKRRARHLSDMLSSGEWPKEIQR